MRRLKELVWVLTLSFSAVKVRLRGVLSLEGCDLRFPESQSPTQPLYDFIFCITALLYRFCMQVVGLDRSTFGSLLARWCRWCRRERVFFYDVPSLLMYIHLAYFTYFFFSPPPFTLSPYHSPEVHCLSISLRAIISKKDQSFNNTYKDDLLQMTRIAFLSLRPHSHHSFSSTFLSIKIVWPKCGTEPTYRSLCPNLPAGTMNMNKILVQPRSSINPYSRNLFSCLRTPYLIFSLPLLFRRCYTGSKAHCRRTEQYSLRQ